jgi:hypothetical protein
VHGKSETGKDHSYHKHNQDNSHTVRVPGMSEGKRLGLCQRRALARVMAPRHGIEWLSATVAGHDRSMSTDGLTEVRSSEEPPLVDERLSTDEQLGSPALSFEEGWLVGLALGALAIFVLARRRARRTPRLAAEV